ncbi:unnamed protein product [Lactuca saligna]|uniref:Uncharacterized protein n=1 Tax=Lactuca saligna TaxID=75948 RepID=A0AA36EA37_LACSI|nr:unnamed protein product [Lactuca saligna]
MPKSVRVAKTTNEVF